MLKCNTPSTTTITTAKKKEEEKKYLRNHVNILTKVLLFNRIHSLGFDADSLTREREKKRKVKEEKNNNDQAEEKKKLFYKMCVIRLLVSD